MTRLSVQTGAVQAGQGIYSARIVILSFFVCLASSSARAFTSADADTLFDAHTAAFYKVQDGFAWHAKSTEGDDKADFWTRAEQMEMVLDAYERTTNQQQLVMFTNLFRGFLADHGKDWSRNPFNDDIMWMAIACTRAHLLTGNPEFLHVARANFDRCYARAASTNLGGGLWWKVGVRSKNACVNGPGAIAAFLLGRATGNHAYLTIATNLFLWERATLFDPNTGKIFDNINANGRLGRFSLTYNQGTFVGAANFLGYTNDGALFDKRNISWHANSGPNLFGIYHDLIQLRHQYPALRNSRVDWLSNSDERKVVTFLRSDDKDELLVVINFSSRPFTGAVGLKAIAGFTPVKISGMTGINSDSLPGLHLNAFEWRIYHRTPRSSSPFASLAPGKN